MAKNSELQRGMVNANIMCMRRKMFGRGMFKIDAAPHFSKLKMFGGTLEIEEFRENSFKDVGPVNEQPVASTPGAVVRSQRMPAESERRVDESKLWEINNAKTNNEPLRLARAKPLKREQNNLASLLGLKRK